MARPKLAPLGLVGVLKLSPEAGPVRVSRRRPRQTAKKAPAQRAPFSSSVEPLSKGVYSIRLGD